MTTASCSPPAPTYSASSEDDNLAGDLDVRSNLTLTPAGSGTVTLDGNLTDRVVHVISGTVALERLTFVRGAPSAPSSGLAGESGGAVLNEATLSVTGCTFTGNSAGRGLDSSIAGGRGGGGGAIASIGQLTLTDSSFSLNTAGRGGDTVSIGPPGLPGGNGGSGGAVFSTGTLTVTRSTFTNNTAGAGGAATFIAGSSGLGGAIGLEVAGATRVTDSTFISNRAGAAGGLVTHGGGIAASQSPVVVTGSTFSANEAQLGGGIFAVVTTVTVVNCTFVGNIATLRGGGVSGATATTNVSSSTFFGNRGGAVAPQGSGTLQVKSSILVGNRAAAGVADRDCEIEAGPVTSAGHNLFGASTGCTGIATDVSVAPAAVATVLSPTLAANGGPTQTLLLPAMSAAIDSGDCTDVAGARLTIDQRGRARPPFACDIGALELDSMARVLVRTEAEPAGMNCPAGGTRLQAGQDDGKGNGVPLDGVLQDGEVEQTRYICNGATGTRALAVATTLGAGDARCPHGGTRIEAGLDDDGDGTLDANEVDSTSYACSGAAGASGPGTVSRLTALAVGDARCPGGGSLLELGSDDDGDGALDPGELDSTASLCNGAAGKGALVRVTALAAGHPQCAEGGAQLDTGVDDDGDGALGAAEVDGTSFVCNGAAGEAGPAGSSGGCQAVPGSGLALLLLAFCVRRRAARLA